MKNRIKQFIKDHKNEVATGASIVMISSFVALNAYQIGKGSVGCEDGGMLNDNAEGQHQFLVNLTNGKTFVFTKTN